VAVGAGAAVAGGGAVVDVVVVVGGTVEVVVVVPACARFEGRTNAAAADVDERDRWPVVWSKVAI
jgi:hypothetical protein